MYTFTEIEVCTNDKLRTGVKLQTSLTLPIDLVKRLRIEYLCTTKKKGSCALTNGHFSKEVTY